MKRQYIFLIILIITIVFNALLLIRNYSHKTRISEVGYHRLELQNKILESNYFNRYYLENETLAPTTKIMTTEGDTSNVSKTISGKKLILFFSEDFCNLCVDNELKIIDSLKIREIVVITKFNSYRDFLIYFKEKKIHYPTYNIIDERLGIFKKDDFQVPLIFYLDSNNTIRYVHIPDKVLPVISFKYYKFLLKKGLISVSP